jgi:hypothetical protein
MMCDSLYRDQALCVLSPEIQTLGDITVNGSGKLKIQEKGAGFAPCYLIKPLTNKHWKQLFKDFDSHKSRFSRKLTQGLI